MLFGPFLPVPGPSRLCVRFFVRAFAIFSGGGHNSMVNQNLELNPCSKLQSMGLENNSFALILDKVLRRCMLDSTGHSFYLRSSWYLRPADLVRCWALGQSESLFLRRRREYKSLASHPTEFTFSHNINFREISLWAYVSACDLIRN